MEGGVGVEDLGLVEELAGGVFSFINLLFVFWEGIGPSLSFIDFLFSKSDISIGVGTNLLDLRDASSVLGASSLVDGAFSA